MDLLFDIVTHSPEETVRFGRKLARELRAPCVVSLEGELGSGKTTLAKGIVAGLGAAREEEVASPSFTLVHEYGDERKVYHADLYRLESAQEISTLGLDDLAVQEATLLVEWGDRLGPDAPASRVTIRLEHLGERERRISVERHTAARTHEQVGGLDVGDTVGPGCGLVERIRRGDKSRTRPRWLERVRRSL